MKKTVNPFCNRISRSIAAILIFHLSVAFQVSSQITPTVTDSLSVASQVSSQITPTVTDSLSVASQVSSQITPTVTDSLSVASQVSSHITTSVTDSLSVASQVRSQITPTVNDSLSVVSQARSQITITVTDSLSFASQVSSHITTSVTDSTELEAVLLLSEYLKIASVTGNEKPGGEFIAEECVKRGLNVRIFTDSIDCYNFAASLYPLELQKPNIILLSHLDVVSGGEDSGWRYPSFSGAVVGDTIWGRGAIDMKQATIMHLMAVYAFAERASAEDLPFNVTLLCVSGEETYGTRGSKIISETFMQELNAVAIFGEGGIGTTGLLSKTPDKPVFFISLSDKRALWLELYLNFRTSGHGAVPPPDYAIRIMINSLNNLTHAKAGVSFSNDSKTMLRAFGDLETGLRGFLLRNPVLFKPLLASGLKKDPLMFSTVTNTITVTHIASEETSINQIPQEIRAFLDCRLLPETSTEWFLDYVGRKLNNNQISINIISETRNAVSTVRDSYYDMIVESLSETYPGCGVIPVLFPATTDNNYFRNKGIPVFGVIPIILGQELLETIHTYNERLPVDALISGTEVYTRFIEKLLPETSNETDSLSVSEL